MDYVMKLIIIFVTGIFLVDNVCAFGTPFLLNPWPHFWSCPQDPWEKSHSSTHVFLAYPKMFVSTSEDKLYRKRPKIMRPILGLKMRRLCFEACFSLFCDLDLKAAGVFICLCYLSQR